MNSRRFLKAKLETNGKQLIRKFFNYFSFLSYILAFSVSFQGDQQAMEALEDPEKPWIFFVLRKITWKIRKLQPTPEKLCAEASFPCTNIWRCSAVSFCVPVTQWRRIYEFIGGKNSVSFVVWWQPLFPTTDTKFQVKRKVDGVQAEDLCIIIIFFENIVKNTLKNP